MTLPIKHFTVKEIGSVIHSELSANKAPGFDLITGRVLKSLPRKCLIYITTIFNAIIRIGHFPLQWKIAQIILTLKPGKDPSDVKSYRPISLLPILSKVFEKLLLKRLKLVINDLIPFHQFGFRERHATIEQINRVVNIINDALENKLFCSAAFLDVCQAFDRVWHVGLKYKLKTMLPHVYYVILKSFIEGRCFQVKYQNVLSELYAIHSGVPQGSVLGPILFILFTADLPNSPRVTIATFADDEAILSVDKDANVASQQLQDFLDALQKWLDKWKIKVNDTKSVHVTFSLRKGNCPPVKINNNEIPHNDGAKYLGMYLDRRLTWRNHIINKRKQLDLTFNKMFWLLGPKSKLSSANKLTVYKTILKPIWTYGIQLWGTSSKSNIEILERFQNKTIRKMFNIPWYISNKYIYQDLKLPLVKHEISKFSENYQTRLSDHPNYLAVNLLDNTLSEFHRLKRQNILDLPFRFNKRN